MNFLKLVTLFIFLASSRPLIGQTRPCLELEMKRNLNDLFEEFRLVYSNAPPPNIHIPFGQLLKLPAAYKADYYSARLVAYRVLLDPLGFRVPLSEAFLKARTLGFEEPFGRFVDLAHGRLTTFLMQRQAAEPPLKKKDIVDILAQVVEIVTK